MNSIFGLSGNNQSNNWFSSMLGGGSSASSSGVAGSLFSDWSMIKNGTYYKLAKAYYGKDSKTSSKDSSVKESAEEKAEKTALTTAKSNADSLKKAADVLMKTDASSVFNMKEVTDKETGITKKEYDTDAIYKAVKNYVDSYNKVVEDTIDSDTVSVLRKTLNMVNNTKANTKLLEKMGITINEDNTLKLDEETFKKSNMLNVKSLFNGYNSLSDRVGSAAGDIVSLSTNVLKGMAKGTYSSSGNYNTMASSVGSSYENSL